MSRTESKYSVSLTLSCGPIDLAEARRFAGDEIEDAAVALDARLPRRRVGAAGRAEQPLEHRARIVLDRQRRRRRAPGDGVGVGAARPAVAGAEHRIRLDAELDRRQLRVLLQFTRGDLIHRDRRQHVGAGGDLERHAGQERARRSRVIAAALDEVGGLRRQDRPSAARDP